MFDFYYELQKCRNKSSLYYVDKKEEEELILSSVLVFFNEKDRKIIIKIYESI